MKDRIQLGIQLDWSRMLGFDQVSASRDATRTRLAKVGLKPMTVGSAGALASEESASPSASRAALGHRIGVKIGAKPGFKP